MSIIVSVCFFFKCFSVMMAMSTRYPLRSTASCSMVRDLVKVAALKTYRVGVEAAGEAFAPHRFIGLNFRMEDSTQVTC
jgi:hypothetical protein